MQISTADLVNKIFAFCETLAGTTLHPYQAVLSKRIIRSVISGEGAEISALYARQAGKSFTISVSMCGMSIILPIMANMPMFLNDRRLKTFQQGFLLGIFAPVKGQSQVIFNNIKGFLGSDTAYTILSDPEINVSFEISNGENLTMKFKNYGIKSTITCMTASEGSNIEGHSYMIIVCDEAQDILDTKYYKSIVPMGAAYNSTNVLIGTPNTRQGFFYKTIQRNKQEYASGLINKSHFEYDWHEIVKYNPLYEKHIKTAMRNMGEDSDEFLASYCLKWMLNRGMFITMEKLDFLGNEDLEAVDEDKSIVHVAGIDLGKTKDSTVVTIGEVDWENPVIIEESKDINVPDYVAYDTTVKSWLEIQGDDWNAQYDKILAFLRRFSITKVVIDATGVGSSIFDRLNAELSRDGIECIPFTFSRPAKSALFKNFDSQIKAGRFHYPAGELTRETLVFKHFKEQMGMLEKSYSGTDMICAAPNTRTAHDDFPVSAALCVWAAKGESRGVMETSNVSIFKSTSKLKSRYAGRNRYSRREW